MGDADWRQYRDRWLAVAEREKEEQRQTSIAQRWRQMNAILGLALALSLPLHDREKDEAIVRERWAKLKGLR